ncbi:MAG: aminotransferase class I/II-fold pyridoxal phosphate-dependent enzyme [Gammaproteobacteria bacterium]|nr:aminotransferase class I/II-fold pyridoxal phosphate-dependent enzyme [Gammaproteobacteria bacterium]
MTRIATRLDGIAPFRVMQILARARALEAEGHDIVHMEIGEPDFVSPEPVMAAGRAALLAGKTHYTPAAGLWDLRLAIAEYYHRRFSVEIDPGRILVTPGASGALQLLLGAIVDPGDRVAVTDPGYPCNRHMIALYGGIPVAIPVSAADDFTVSSAQLAEAMTGGLRALMLASPANPTGNLVDIQTVAALADQLAASNDSLLICDEIYQGLQYDREPQTALSLRRDNIVVVNSFSKYFGMTGWRIGWIVAPEWLIDPMERLAQNLFLAAPTLGQYAALAAFSDRTRKILEQRRREFGLRRDFMYAALRDIGLVIEHPPSGAFYLYADVSAHAGDCQQFCSDLLDRAGVAVTPGVDFGNYRAADHVRFAFTTGLDGLELGVERIRRFLAAGG